MGILRCLVLLRSRAAVLAVLLAVVVSIVGCGSEKVADSPVPPPSTPVTPPTTPTPPDTPTPPGNPTTPPPPSTPSMLVSGKVLAGSLPISGASVQVYAAGTTGNGMGAAALLSSPVSTDDSGTFTISSGLNCISPSSMLYLVARGGHVGSNSPNTNIALLTTIGACGQLSSSTTMSFTMNEVTTVAAVWALSQFMARGGVVGVSSTNAKGLYNAFATAATLADRVTGQSPGTGFPNTGNSPAPKINALANLLNTCVAFSGAAPTPNACDRLFSSVTVGNPAAPSDTLDAALSLARNPGSNVASIYGQSITSTIFSPVLSSEPTDWTLSVNYTGGGMDHPTGVAVDSQGNIWVASYFGVVSEFTPTGAPTFASGITGSGIRSSYGLAIDSENNVWIANGDSPPNVNRGLGTVTVLNSRGQPLSGTNGFSAGGLNAPIAIAIDTNGTAWVVDYGNARLTLLSSTGTPLSGTAGYSAPTLAFPASIAIDGNHNGWIGNQNDSVVTRISADGTQTNGISCCNGPQGLAVDHGGYIWVANFYGDSVSQLSPSGAILASGYTSEGLFHPQGIAVDGAGSVWTVGVRNAAGAASPTLAQMAGSGAASPGRVLSPSSGWLADAKLLVPLSLAIDASGNLWITNMGSNSLTEVVGFAAPVRTPLNGPPQAP